MRWLRGTLSAHVSAEMSERSKEHDWKSCVPRKGTMGSNPILCASNTPKRGVFSLLRGFEGELLVFGFAELCTCMRIDSKRYFYVAVSCKTLADIYIDTAFCAPRNKCTAQIMKFMSRAEALEGAAHDIRFSAGAGRGKKFPEKFCPKLLNRRKICAILFVAL